MYHAVTYSEQECALH